MRYFLQCLFDDVCHLQEAAALLTESEVHHLIGGIDDTGSVATPPYRFVCHLQAAELLWVGLLEGQVLEVPPVDAREAALQSIGVGEGQLNGHAHVRHTHLSLDGTVLELDSAVQDALRMHHDLYPLGCDVEQPACLDDLEAFVHHRRAVDGYLCPHVPVGMLQGLCRCDVAQLVEREGAERATAGREDEFLDGTHFAHQALEDGAVLAIDRQQRHLVLQAKLRDEFASHNEGLFVGEGDGFASLDGTDGGTQSAEAHKGSQHDIHRLHLHHLAQGVGSRIDLYRLVLQGFLYVVVLVLVCYDDALRLVFLSLLDEQVGLRVGSQHVCLEEVRVLRDYLKRLSANTAG